MQMTQNTFHPPVTAFPVFHITDSDTHYYDHPYSTVPLTCMRWMSYPLAHRVQQLVSTAPLAAYTRLSCHPTLFISDLSLYI